MASAGSDRCPVEPVVRQNPVLAGAIDDSSQDWEDVQDGDVAHLAGFRFPAPALLSQPSFTASRSSEISIVRMWWIVFE
jgi:hypothetical protein